MGMASARERLLAAIEAILGEHDTATFRRADLERAAGVSPAQVKRLLREIEADGSVAITRGNGRGHPSTITRKGLKKGAHVMSPFTANEPLYEPLYEPLSAAPKPAEKLSIGDAFPEFEKRGSPPKTPPSRFPPLIPLLPTPPSPTVPLSQKKTPDSEYGDSLPLQGISADAAVGSFLKRVAGKKRPAVSWPAGFVLTEDMAAYAKAHKCLRPEVCWEIFEHHHRSRDARFVDWGRAWATWCLNHHRYGCGVKPGDVPCDEAFARRMMAHRPYSLLSKPRRLLTNGSTG